MKTKDEHTDPVDASRRHAFALATASLAAPLVSVPAVVGAQQSKYGILGEQAPELSMDYWIDGAGEPAVFQ